MNEDKRKYELSYLLSFKLEEKDALLELDKIHDFIKKSEGEIILEEAPAKRRLAYPIKKEQEAYFGWLEFLINPDKIEELKTHLRHQTDILRFLIFVKKEKKSAIKKMKERDLRKPLQPQEESNELEKKLNELITAVKK